MSTARALGDRKDYFTAAPDLWEAVRMLAAGQARRRIRPVLDRLQSDPAEGTDPRTAEFELVLRHVAEKLEDFAALDVAATAAAFHVEPDESTSPTRKKKKKKKKKDAGGS